MKNIFILTLLYVTGIIDAETQIKTYKRTGGDTIIVETIHETVHTLFVDTLTTYSYSEQEIKDLLEGKTIQKNWLLTKENNLEQASFRLQNGYIVKTQEDSIPVVWIWVIITTLFVFISIKKPLLNQKELLWFYALMIVMSFVCIFIGKLNANPILGFITAILGVLFVYFIAGKSGNIVPGSILGAILGGVSGLYGVSLCVGVIDFNKVLTSHVAYLIFSCLIAFGVRRFVLSRYAQKTITSSES